MERIMRNGGWTERMENIEREWTTADGDERLLRNLSDAGCDAETVEAFLRLREKGRTREQIRLLARQRAALLRRLHEDQGRIDSLDWLLYEMKRHGDDADSEKTGGARKNLKKTKSQA